MLTLQTTVDGVRGEGLHQVLACTTDRSPEHYLLVANMSIALQELLSKVE